MLLTSKKSNYYCSKIYSRYPLDIFRHAEQLCTSDDRADKVNEAPKVMKSGVSQGRDGNEELKKLKAKARQTGQYNSSRRVVLLPLAKKQVLHFYLSLGKKP